MYTVVLTMPKASHVRGKGCTVQHNSLESARAHAMDIMSGSLWHQSARNIWISDQGMILQIKLKK